MGTTGTHTSRVGGRALTFESMGTVVSIRLGVGASESGVSESDASGKDKALAGRLAAAVFSRWDGQFSLYRPDSELSRINDGRLRLPDSSVAMRDCYAAALEWRARTNGVFTPHRLDGAIDLSGIVKGLALAEAGHELSDAGLLDWCLNAGGDLQSSGRPSPEREWMSGVVDPTDRGSLLATVPTRHPSGALATSGGAERGEHIWTMAHRIPSPFTQVSVRATDIVTADVLATAIVAGGEETLEHCTSAWPIDVLVVRRNGELLATPGWHPAE